LVLIVILACIPHHFFEVIENIIDHFINKHAILAKLAERPSCLLFWKAWNYFNSWIYNFVDDIFNGNWCNVKNFKIESSTFVVHILSTTLPIARHDLLDIFTLNCIWNLIYDWFNFESRSNIITISIHYYHYLLN